MFGYVSIKNNCLLAIRHRVCKIWFKFVDYVFNSSLIFVTSRLQKAGGPSYYADLQCTGPHYYYL